MIEHERKRERKMKGGRQRKEVCVYVRKRQKEGKQEYGKVTHGVRVKQTKEEEEKGLNLMRAFRSTLGISMKNSLRQTYSI